MFIHTQGCIHPHMSPYSSVHLYVLRGFCMLWGVVGTLRCWMSPFHAGHLHHMVDASLYVLPPTHWLASLCIILFWGYLHVIWGIFPLCWRFGGVPPSVGGFGGISTWGVHMLFLYILLVVNYVSHFYYSYDYYSSSYDGVFWIVICFISDHGSFPDGASLQHWASMKWFNSHP